MHAPGDSISFDIMYACAPHCHSGQRYVLVFTDQYSRHRKAYLLHRKNDSAAALDQYINFCVG